MAGIDHRGVYAAPLTPFRNDASVDLVKYIAHCRALLAAGCQGLMPIGSTGEGHSLTVAERLAMMDALAESGLPTARMLIGTSALALPDTVAMARHAVAIGAGGVCVQPPFYYKPADDEGLFRFFARVIEEVADPRLALFVYDWEPNIHVHHSLAFFRRLFEAFPDSAVGIKDSSGDDAQLRARIQAFPDRTVFAGTDGATLSCLRAGGAGIMSGMSNVMPEVTTRLFAGFETDEGAAMQARVDAAREAMAGLPYFAALKQMMAWRSADPSWRNPRPALRPLTAEEAARLHARLDAIAFPAGDAAAA